jgi:hypothetical protein
MGKREGKGWSRERKKKGCAARDSDTGDEATCKGKLNRHAPAYVRGRVAGGEDRLMEVEID